MTKLEYLRRCKGLSQVQIGKQLGVHPTNITLIERGYRKAWPRIRSLLADTLGVSEHTLFHLDGTATQIEDSTE